jgi:hypothetical protein
MSGDWLHNIKHVTPGEPVQAGVVGRPDRVLEARTDYLKDRLDAAELGRALFEMDATIASDVLPGHPVFWNAATQRYEKALAAVSGDAESQAFVTQPSSDCVGLCFKKKSETRGDIVLRGLVEFESADIANSVTVPIESGRYFLSAAEPGKLSRQRPPVTVSVCHIQGPNDSCTTRVRVIVMPQFKDFLEDHTHYRFDLVATPAGTNTVELVDGQERHRILSPNAELPGWLPADHAVFEGKAPAGALFGYNLSKHPSLARVWPPIPIQSVAMLWDKGAEQLGAAEIPLGTNGLAIADTHGIWWMSDCYGDVPWPTNYPENATAQDGDECPRAESMRVVVVYLRMLVGNDRRVVTSLAPAVASPIEVLNCDNMPATTGDLKLDLNLQEIDCEPLGETAGGKVYGEIVDKHKLKKNWVTEGVVAHNQSRLAVTGTWNRILTEQEKLDLNISTDQAVTAYQGLVKINLDDQAAEREISPQIVRLNDAVERLYMDIPYLGLPEAQESSLRLRLNIPYVNLGSGDSLQMTVRVQLFGRGGSLAGTPTALPALEMTKRTLAAPGEDVIALAPDSSETALTFPADSQTIALLRDKVVQRDSESFLVSPGDTILVTIRRPLNPSDVYNAEVGILRVSGILFTATV